MSPLPIASNTSNDNHHHETSVLVKESALLEQQLHQLSLQEKAQRDHSNGDSSMPSFRKQEGVGLGRMTSSCSTPSPPRSCGNNSDQDESTDTPKYGNIRPKVVMEQQKKILTVINIIPKLECFFRKSKIVLPKKLPITMQFLFDRS
jgi:hypothetical protein